MANETKKFTAEQVEKMTADEIKKLSPEDQKAIFLVKKGIAAKLWAERQVDFSLIKELCDKTPDKKYLEALKRARPSLFGEKVAKAGKSAVVSIANQFIALVADKKTISEDDVFKALKIGRKDALGYIKAHLKTAAIADRLWINFEPVKGVYSLVGKGENAPASYSGPKPVAAVAQVAKVEAPKA